MLVLKVPEKVLDAARVYAQRGLARQPRSWADLSGLGKIRRYAGDRGGLAQLREAAESCLELSVGDQNPDAKLPAANLFRLAGDQTRAQEVYTIAYDALAQRFAERGPNSVDTPTLMTAAFVLGFDQEVLEARQALSKPNRRPAPTLWYPYVAELARARQSGDPALCDEPIARFDKDIKRGSPTDTAGGIDAYDWLELALITQSQLAGTISPRLMDI